ncbi:hypothetical protein GOZ91_17325 [Agrobacterium vitis]|nr:hypothetical protein [Agrobacterium vitis]
MYGMEQRLQALESIEVVKQLKVQYCLHCDDNYNGAAISSLFTEDGAWESDTFGRYEGRDAIASYFDAISARISFAAHLLMNPIVTITAPDRAIGKWRLLMPCTAQEAGRPEAYWLTTSYSDRFRRVDGRWYFEDLQARTEIFAPHRFGWAQTA